MFGAAQQYACKLEQNAGCGAACLPSCSQLKHACARAVLYHFLQSAQQSFVPLVRRTTLLNWFYRALGVRIGRNVIIDTDDLLGYDAIELRDDCVLDAACGVSAITYEAGKPADRFPHGTMKVKSVVLGERALVGPHAMVTSGHVAADAVILPCSATSNPPAVWKGSSMPTSGPQARAAVNTQEPQALGVLSGLAALWCTSLLITLMAYPVVGECPCPADCVCACAQQPATAF